MTEADFIQQIQKGIDLKNDGTYTSDADRISHMTSIVRDALGQAAKHKEQLERMLFKYTELRRNQSMYFSGHKDKLSLCRSQEKELDQKAAALLKMGYTIDRFNQPPPKQGSLI